MSKLKPQKEKDLQELTEKLKEAKSVVFTDYRGTTVKDLDKFRKALKKENVFSKVYKITLVRKAMEANGIDAASVQYKTPVILALSNEDEVAPARIVKNLTKDIKTLSILEGIMEGKVFSKAQVEAMGDLPGKDQLRAQFLATIMGPVSAFVRVLDAKAKQMGEAVSAVVSESAPEAPVAAEPAAA
jgi:large subunit ribosomal protein L10